MKEIVFCFPFFGHSSLRNDLFRAFVIFFPFFGFSFADFFPAFLILVFKLGNPKTIAISLNMKKETQHKIHGGIEPPSQAQITCLNGLLFKYSTQVVTVKFFETPRSVFLLPCSARKLLAVDCHERSAVAYSCRSLRCIR